TGLTSVTGNLMGWLNTTIDPYGAITNVPLQSIRITFGTAYTFTDKKGNFEFQNVTSPGQLSASWISSQHFQGVFNTVRTSWSFTTTATPGTPVNIQVFTSALTERELAQSNAAWLVVKVNDYAHRVIDNVSPYIDGLIVNVNLNQTCNAYFSVGTPANP